MTEQTPVAVSSAPSYAPDFLHELLWQQIRSILGDQIMRMSPRMGTVAGTTGTSLLVLPDGSAVPRAMPHIAGRRFKTGDRVIIAPVQGLPVVIGGVLTAAGAAEAVVDKIDLSTEMQQLLDGFKTSITQLTTSVGINGGNAANSTGLWQFAWQAYQAGTGAAEKVGDRSDNLNVNTAFGRIASAENHIQDVYNLSARSVHAHNYAATGHNHDGSYAPSPHSHNNYDARLDYLCKKVHPDHRPDCGL